jgi:hypothetical protein
MIEPVANPGLAFVHIPKNAGTTLARVIGDHKLPIGISDHSYPVRLAQQEIVVLRCPVDRFISAFNYGRKRWPNAVNAQFSSADELARSAADPEHPKHRVAWIELGNRPEDFLLRNGKPTACHTVAGRRTALNWVYEPQSSWLINQPLHVLRYRHLSQDFAELLESAALGGVDELPRLNQGDANAENLTELARAFLERIYADDLAYFRAHRIEV